MCHFRNTNTQSTFTARLDVPCSPPQISEITFNAILTDRVNCREEVFSELQCVDAYVRRHTYKAYNMEIAGLGFQCTTLSMIKKRLKKRWEQLTEFLTRKASRRSVVSFIVKTYYRRTFLVMFLHN